MVKFKVNFNQARFKGILSDFSTLLNKNIVAVLKNEALPFFVDRVMVGYDTLIDRANLLPEDPTNPANWREIFRVSLLEDIEQTFKINGSHLEVNVGDKTFLGYTPSGENNNPNESDGLEWMVYYLEGLAGDWAFIGPEMYERFRGSNSFDSTWGRFGKGFMLSRERFEEEGWDELVSFDSVRHPFSGYAPVDIFTEALREFSLRPFIEKAIKAAVEGKEL